MQLQRQFIAIFRDFVFAQRLSFCTSSGNLFAASSAKSSGTGRRNSSPERDTSAEPENTKDERWNIFWQATSIGEYHGTFRSPYEGPNSLRDTPERDVSLTSTLYLGFRLFDNTQIYVNGEFAGGRGFSGVTGIADFPNGEMPRVASATPKPYLARAYFSRTSDSAPSASSLIAKKTNWWAPGQ